jgi:transcription termination factor Rho
MSTVDTAGRVEGILDLTGNQAFVRTRGYRPGPDDVNVPQSLVRRFGLRRGDRITGTETTAPEGKTRRAQLAVVDTVNGVPATDLPERRPVFEKFTPLHPQERLRLETTSNQLTARVIDLVMPIGKGQRALIVSPPKAGKTSVLQAIANAVARNAPECHLMMLLIDERPEEVTDIRRSVHGEVIASTFDREPAEHTVVAELALEHAKRRAENGEDVVLLLDSITRLGRAYNLAAKNSGRVLTGGVDSATLHPLKRMLGAARNLEHGGSLTIVATAMVENGSAADTLFFEELKSTGNAELKLDRRLAERRVFPAVDLSPTGTRREELLLTPDELLLTTRLHRALQSREGHPPIEQLLDQLRKTRTNAEFLLRLAPQPQAEAA